jgi:hypothetical protein
MTARAAARQLDNKLRFCRCAEPDRKVVANSEYWFCANCGELVVDPVTALLAGKVRALSRRVEALEARRVGARDGPS